MLIPSHAQFSLGEYQKAIDAYEAGLKLDPSNNNMKSSLATAKTRLGEQSPSSSDREAAPSARGAGGAPGGMPDLAAMASMFGGGGGGGGGGMPDLASMMQNPQMMAM